MVVRPDGDPTGRNDQVGRPERDRQRVRGRLRLVVDSADQHELRARLADQGRHHDALDVPDLSRFRVLAHRHEFMPADDQCDPRTAVARELRMSRARCRGEVVGGDAQAGRQHDVAGPQVLASPTHVRPTCDGVIDLERPADLTPCSRGTTASAPLGQRRAGRDDDGRPDVESAAEGGPRRALTDDRQAPRGPRLPRAPSRPSRNS